MTSAITNSAFSPYTSLLQPAQADNSSAASLLPLLDGSANDNSASASSLASSSAVGGLDTGTPQLSANVVALLQQLLPGASNDTASLLNTSAATDSVSGLLGGGTDTSAVDAQLNQSENGLLTAAYASAVQAAYQGTAQQSAASANSTDPVETVLAQYQAASNAYNTTAQQTAASVLAANSFGADGSVLT